MFLTSKLQMMMMTRFITQTLNFIFTVALLSIALIALLEQLTQKYVMFVLGDMMLQMMGMNVTRIMQQKSFEFTCSLQEL